MSVTTQSYDPAAFVRAMGAVARELLGEPNAALSSRDELRFGTRGSLSVDLTKGTWCDHENGDAGGGVLDLLKVKKMLGKGDALQWLQERKHLPPTSGSRSAVAEYDYRNADGVLLYQVIRFDPKDFRQRRPDGTGGWSWKLGDVQRVPYRLPELLAADRAELVFIVEGEKDVDNLCALGLVATCNAGGAAKPGQRSKWPERFTQFFAGRDVVVLPDNDEPGEAHARAVADSLSSATSQASSLRIVRLPQLPPKGDTSDWLARGGTVAQLRDLVAEAPLYTALQRPEAASSVLALPRPQDALPGDLSTYLLNEDSLGLAFAEAHASRLRYCHHACHWFVWTGSIWRREETQLGFHLAREICRAAALRLPPEDNNKKTLAKAATVASVERLAKADRRLAVEASAWDRDGWLLGTPEGTVDLRTGILRPSSQDDLITKSASVTPAAPGTPHPIWDGFLQQATGNDLELIAFLQRLVGYCLTGDVTEEMLAFLYGDGGTGKGTFIGTIVAILHDYAVSVPIEAFTAGARLSLEYYRAQMAGARLVTASETEGGATWAESQIKEMTGNETPLSGRHPYGKVFTYQPTFKIVLIGNHAPRLKARSKAMERRLRIVPFKHKPPAVDQSLKERLRAEYPAILRWMIEGCLAWQRQRLGSCAAVAAESGAYFEQQDHFGRWLEERCLVAESFSEKPSRLLSDFISWAKENNEPVLTSGEFREMIERTPGLRYSRTKGNQRVRGIGLQLSPADLDSHRARYGDQ